MITKILYVISLFVIASAISVSLLFWFWSLTPSEIITINKKPVPVIDKTVKRGGIITQVYSFCKNSNIDGLVEPFLVSNRYVLPLPPYAEQTKITKPCYKNIPVPMLLPNSAPNTYHIHYKVTYQVNPIRQDIVEWDSENFQIVE